MPIDDRPPRPQRGKTVHGEAANAGHRALAPDDAEVEAYLENGAPRAAPERSPRNGRGGAAAGGIERGPPGHRGRARFRQPARTADRDGGSSSTSTPSCFRSTSSWTRDRAAAGRRRSSVGGGPEACSTTRRHIDPPWGTSRHPRDLLRAPPDGRGASAEASGRRGEADTVATSRSSRTGSADHLRLFAGMLRGAAVWMSDWPVSIVRVRRSRATADGLARRCGHGRRASPFLRIEFYPEVVHMPAGRDLLPQLRPEHRRGPLMDVANFIDFDRPRSALVGARAGRPPAPTGGSSARSRRGGFRPSRRHSCTAPSATGSPASTSITVDERAIGCSGAFSATSACASRRYARAAVADVGPLDDPEQSVASSATSSLRSRRRPDKLGRIDSLRGSDPYVSIQIDRAGDEGRAEDQPPQGSAACRRTCASPHRAAADSSRTRSDPLGLALGLPDAMVTQPFPGPGLAIRIIAKLDAQNGLSTLREGDWIVDPRYRRPPGCTGASGSRSRS